MNLSEKALDLILSQAEFANTIAVALIAALVALIVFLVRQTAGLEGGRIVLRAKSALTWAILLAGVSSVFYYLLIGTIITTLPSFALLEKRDTKGFVAFFREEAPDVSLLALLQGTCLVLAVFAVIVFAVRNRRLIR